jgi:hypothetical protein
MILHQANLAFPVVFVYIVFNYLLGHSTIVGFFSFDSYQMCCHFLQIVVGRERSELLTNEAGEVTRQEISLACLWSDHVILPYLIFCLCELCSHLQGMLNRTVGML